MPHRSPPSIALLFLGVTCSLATAQIPDSLRGRNDLQSTLYIASDGSRPNDITPMFLFSMHYDSSRTIFTFGECKLNGVKIHMPTWHFDSTITTMEADQLSNYSRTASMKLTTGDTISFYRELGWYNPHTEEQIEEGYYALDSLDYAIELVESNTGIRKALLDSIGVLSRVNPGRPVFHGSRPIIAHVKYAVPPQFDEDSAYIRIKLYVRGTGPHYTIRHDELTVNPSLRLADPAWLDYLNTFGGALGRRNIQELSHSTIEPRDNSSLQVYPNPSSGDVQIEYTVSDRTTSIAIAIYDQQGELLFIPSMGVTQPGILRASYTFSANGSYYVAVVRDGNLITATKVTVQR